MSSNTKTQWRIQNAMCVVALFVLVWISMPERAEAAITLVATSSDTSSGVSAVSPVIPTGTAANDVMVAWCFQSVNAAANTWDDDGAGDGWSQLFSLKDTGGRDREVAIYYKVATGADSTPTFTIGGSANTSCSISTWRGVNTSSPFDVVWSEGLHFYEGVNNTVPNPPSIDTISDGAIVLVYQAATHNDISVAGAPAGYTLFEALVPGASFNHRQIFGAYNEVAIAATEDPGVWTHTASPTDTAEYSGTVLALAPVSATTTISGSLFSDAGVTKITDPKTIKIAIGTSTKSIHTATTSSGDWSFELATSTHLTANTPVVVWVDGDASVQASTFTKLAFNDIQTIAGLNLYQDRVIVRHESSASTASTTNVDLTFHDRSDDSDIQFTATTSTLRVHTGNELFIWSNTTFNPGGTTTISANATASSTDGSLFVSSNAIFEQTGPITIGGNLTLLSGSLFISGSATTTFTATTTGKIIDGNATAANALGNVNFSGSGGAWQTTDDVTVANFSLNAGGTFTVATNTIFAVAGNFTNSGVYQANNATTEFNADEYKVETAVINSVFDVSSQDVIPTGLEFNTDGTKMFMLGIDTDSVYEYDLSIAFTISSSIFSTSTDVSAEDTNMFDLTFNPMGTKMFLVGDDNDAVYEYMLSTAFDVSSASFAASTSVASQDDSPRTVEFNPAGTKMFISGAGNDSFYEYVVSDPFDITSISFASSLSYSPEAFTISDIFFNASGTKMLGIDVTADEVHEYGLVTPYDLNAMKFISQVPFSMHTAPQSIDFNNDGSKLFILDSSSDNVTEYILSAPDSPQAINGDMSALQIFGNMVFSGVFEKTLSVKASTSDMSIKAGSGVVAPTSITIAGQYSNEGLFDSTDNSLVFDTAYGFDTTFTLKPNRSTSVTDSGTVPTDVGFSTDGSIMFVTNSQTDTITSYTLSVEFDVRTASRTASFGFGTDVTVPEGFTFNTDGTELYVVGSNRDRVTQYTLSSAFDISSASFTATTSVALEELTPTGVAISTDGTKLFVIGGSSDEVNQYDLLTPFDVSTANASKALSVGGTIETIAEDLVFDSTGTKLFITGQNGSDLTEYVLTTAFDVGTATFVQDSMDEISISNPSVTGLAFNTTGTKLYTVGELHDTVTEYRLATPITGNMIGESKLNSVTIVNNSQLKFLDHASTSNITINSDASMGISASSTLEIAGIFTNTGEFDAGVSTLILAEGSTLSGNFVSTSSLYDVTVTGVSTLAASTTITGDFVVQPGGDFNQAAHTLTFSNSPPALTSAEHLVTSDSLVYDALATDFNADGTILFALRSSQIASFTLNEPYNIASGTLLHTLAISEVSFASGFTFNTTGDEIFVTDSNEDVHRYDLSTAFTLSGGSFGTTTDFSSDIGELNDIEFSNDGTNLFLLDDGVTNKVLQYDLSVAFDVNTRTLVASSSLEDGGNGPHGLAFNHDGTILYVVDDASDHVTEYVLLTSFDITTLETGTALAVGDVFSFPLDVDVADRGQMLYVSGGFGEVQQFVLRRTDQTLSGNLVEAAALESVVFTGESTKTFVAVASTSDFTISASSTVVASSSGLTVAGDYTNNGTFTAGTGTVHFSGANKTLVGNMVATSSFNHLSVTGSYSLVDLASTTDLTIVSGGALTATSGLTVLGDFTNNGTFIHATGTVFMAGNSSTTAQVVSGSATGDSGFYNLIFSGSSTKSVTGVATTTNLSILSTAATTTFSNTLTLLGDYTNEASVVDFDTSTVVFAGTNQQIASGTLRNGGGVTGAFNNITILNSSQNGTTTQSVIFASTTAVAGTFIMRASSSAQFPASATSTFTNIDLVGSTTGPAYLRSSVPGSEWGMSVSGTQVAVSYVDVRDSNACAGTTVRAFDGTNTDSGNNDCWDFTRITPAISSAADQTFAISGPTTTISTITVTEATSPTITAANDIRIVIASSSVNMRFDTTDTTAIFGGTAALKVSNPVSYNSDGSVLVVPVDTNFVANDTLTIAGLSYTNFNSTNTAAVALSVRNGGAGDTDDEGVDDKTVAIVGLLTLTDSDAGVAANQFSFKNIDDEVGYTFKLIPTSDTASVSEIVFSITDVSAEFSSSMIDDIALYRDLDGDGDLDGAEPQIGGVGLLSVGSATGTITFSTTFTATTAQNYILTFDTNAIARGVLFTLELSSGGVVATGVTLGDLVVSGSATAVSHLRSSGGSGGAIGGDAQTGNGVETGGDESGGDSVGDDDDGENIASNPNFFAPTTNGDTFNGWTNPINALLSDGTDASAATSFLRQSYGDFGFNIPSGNTIEGVIVKVDAADSAGAGGVLRIALSPDGGISSTTLKSTGTLTTADVVYELGGASDTWGRTWSPEEFNDGNFEVIIESEVSGGTNFVDGIEVRVFHQSTGGGSGGGGAI